MMTFHYTHQSYSENIYLNFVQKEIAWPIIPNEQQLNNYAEFHP